MRIRKTNLNELQKYIYYGLVDSITSLTTEEVLSLDGFGVDSGKELRVDRFRTFFNIIPNGKYLAICIPVAFGGEGKFFSNQTTLFYNPNTILDFIDDDGKQYAMNVYVSPYSYNGDINELKIL